MWTRKSPISHLSSLKGGEEIPHPHLKGVDKMTKEKQILQFMEKLKISREEAEQLFLDDQEDFIGQDGEEMTSKAKDLKRYEQADKPRKKMEKTRKVDTDKKYLLEEVSKCLADVDELEIISMKNEVELSFKFKMEDYTIKLTKHRKKKSE